MKAEINMKKVTRSLTAKVKVKRKLEFMLRLKIGIWIMRFAASVIGCNIDLEIVEDLDESV